MSFDTVTVLFERDLLLKKVAELESEVARLRASGPMVTGETSDGYHTLNELYDHRISLFIALCAVIHAEGINPVWRSKLHSDGTMFDGGWFIMGIGSCPGEQISYHLPVSRWSDTDFLGSELERAPEFDGHTSDDVLHRLRVYYRG